MTLANAIRDGWTIERAPQHLGGWYVLREGWVNNHEISLRLALRYVTRLLETSEDADTAIQAHPVKQWPATLYGVGLNATVYHG